VPCVVELIDHRFVRFLVEPPSGLPGVGALVTLLIGGVNYRATVQAVEGRCFTVLRPPLLTWPPSYPSNSSPGDRPAAGPLVGERVTVVAVSTGVMLSLKVRSIGPNSILLVGDEATSLGAGAQLLIRYGSARARTSVLTTSADGVEVAWTP
jgi:hypothetical protein